MDRKLEWTENDFDKLGWHDCKIHAIAFDDQNFELHLDIDYILKWIQPKGSEYFTFEIIQCILTFREVHDIDVSMHSLDVVIDEIVKSEAESPKLKHGNNILPYRWTIETSCGEISFFSTGFKQTAKSEAITSDLQNTLFANRKLF